MAQKRMFSKNIIDSDRFYDLPIESQLLYFHLGLSADVKGFIEPKKIVRLVGLKIDSLKPLIETNLIIPFESGVIVITDWNSHNNVREDREAPTQFITELKQLTTTNVGKYQLQEDSRSTPAQIRLDKIRLDKIRRERKKKNSPSKIKYLQEIPLSDIREFITKFNCDTDQVIEKGLALKDYCLSKDKRYKDYKAFLRNSLRKDYGSRNSEPGKGDVVW